MNDHAVSHEALSVYRGRRVLVTGHTGFKGPWLCAALLELGADVCGYALAPDEGSHFGLLGLDGLIRHVEADIRDLPTLSRVMTEHRPEFVFHLAAQALVRPSYDEPARTFETNVMGSVNVLEAARHCESLRALVHVTSDKCYLNREWEWGYRENDRLGGRDPYSASKAAAEIVFAAYAASYLDAMPALGAASARAGNVIGGGDWATDRIVPDCIRALRAARPISIRSPKATRPWQHVLESTSGYLLLGARLFEAPQRHSGAWNFGPEDRDIRTVEDLATAVVREWGSGSVVTNPPDPERHEAHALHLNCDKAHRLLGWRPRWDFDRAVRETVEWYRRAEAAPASWTFTQEQVRRYFSQEPS